MQSIRYSERQSILKLQVSYMYAHLNKNFYYLLFLRNTKALQNSAPHALPDQAVSSFIQCKSHQELCTRFFSGPICLSLTENRSTEYTVVVTSKIYLADEITQRNSCCYGFQIQLIGKVRIRRPQVQKNIYGIFFAAILKSH